MRPGPPASRRGRGASGPYLIDMEVLWDQVAAPDCYPYALPAVRGLGTLAFHPRVTFFVGDNGTGKSTLLEAIAVASGLNPEGMRARRVCAPPGPR